MLLVPTAGPILLVADANGVIRVSRSRVTLDTLITAFLEGCTAEEIREQYPSLQISDIYFAIGYYLRHQSQVNAYLMENQRLAGEVQQEAERRFNPVGIRDRLLARRHQKGWFYLLRFLADDNFNNQMV
ncbi:DUF433 domain-containing protein [Microcoleus sp. B3-A4]|uniref:DUF433 domain-containing protein n=1 Tax=Microcoleus sp. B3-A4 TaxID=2818653 RepID=UPI002FD1B0D2